MDGRGAEGDEHQTEGAVGKEAEGEGLSYKSAPLEQNEARPDYVEVIPYGKHFIEANIYKQPTHFKAPGGWGPKQKPGRPSFNNNNRLWCHRKIRHQRASGCCNGC